MKWLIYSTYADPDLANRKTSEMLSFIENNKKN